MGRIFYIMGKSASGKDSIFKKLLEDPELKLKTVVMYTTRPMRDGEEEGREYFFRDTDFFEQAEKDGTVIESRTYQTVCGPWTYFTLDDDQIDLEEGNYLMIGTLESYANTKAYFDRRGVDALVPILIWVEDGERIIRAVRREQSQNSQNYAELCRRFLADEADFSEENRKKCGITEYYENNDLETCLEKIRLKILKM